MAFQNVSSLACRFDYRTIVNATFVSSTQIRCRSPPANGIVAIQVTLDGLRFTDSFVQYTYNRRFHINNSILIFKATCPGNPTCSSHGYCSSGTCNCFWRYEGPSCSNGKVQNLFFNFS